jgi:hypothetical protein
MPKQLRDHRFFRLWTIVFMVGGIFLLAACSAGDSGGAAEAVEAYYQALTEENVDQMKSLSCADWEEFAQLEFDAFAGVKTALKDLRCEVTGTEGDDTLVSCTGAIVATYGTEDQEFELDGLIFRTVQEAGEWRMCGN